MAGRRLSVTISEGVAYKELIKQITNAAGDLLHGRFLSPIQRLWMNARKLLRFTAAGALVARNRAAFFLRYHPTDA
jgi:hypothetical protein